jgi:eukaryotic-like serine/threonine-protein kinase
MQSMGGNSTKPSAERMERASGAGEQDVSTTAPVRSRRPRAVLSDSLPGALSLEEFCQQLPAGTRVGEHYVVTELLGYGGMGVVMRARDELLMRDVAVKFLQPQLLAKPSAHQAMLTEARAMARIKHPNVVEVYAFGTHLGVPYFVMEYVHGRTAEEWLMARSHGLREFIPLDEVLGVLDQCCTGVAAIHAMGAVHGDLKPTNLLLTEGWRVAIADFGIAMLLDAGDPRQSGGTPDYLAPEAFDELDDPALIQRRDVFALGVMAYEFLTNERPFPELSMDVFLSQARVLPPPPSELRADLPPAFDRVILDALALDPRTRTASMGELRQQLRNARTRASERPRATHVLLVEDDLSFANFVQLSLETHIPGVQVTHCANGNDALRCLGQRPVELLIVDLGLPDMNGIELTAEARARWPDSRMPILVATAQGSAADWKVLQGLGANGFLAKPVGMKALIATVMQQLDPDRAVFGRARARTPA